MTDDTPDLGSEGRRARMAIAALGLSMTIDGLICVALLAQGRLLATAAADGYITDAQSAASDSRIAFLNQLHVAVLVLGGITFLAWLFRAYDNVRRVGTRASAATAGWAVGYWFIPIVNVFRPYLIMKELTIRSTRRNEPGLDPDRHDAGVVGFWWATWIAAGFYTRYVSRQWDAASSPLELLALNWKFVICNLLSMFAAALAIYIIRRIHLAQQRWAIVAAEPLSEGLPAT